MIPSKTIPRAVSIQRSAVQSRCFYSFRASTPYALRRQQHFVRSVALVAAAGLSASAFTYYNGGSLIRDVHADEPEQKPAPVELVFEEKVVPGASKNETRDRISSQHLQVRKSWENPGVWCWGANDGKVAAPDTSDGIVRNPRWMAYFDGKLLRDLKLTRDFGAAISEDGDLLQWGSSYSNDETAPVKTLTGKNLTSLAISKDRILALARDGQVYSLSVSQDEQHLGPKPKSASWIPGFPSTSAVSYRTITPQDLGWNEKIIEISSGLEHALILTSKGRVFSSASASSDFPSKGEFGIPGLTWFTRPAGPYDQAHEIHALGGFKVSKIACGDHHSVALDRQGRVFTWGDNQRGQLGIGDTSKEVTFYDTPALVPIAKLYQGTMQRPKVTSVSAGGNTTFFTVDAERIAAPDASDRRTAMQGLGRVTADTWACGHGIWGQLGNGRWTHVQALPCKIAPLSGLFEYDEARRRAIPIRLREVSVGANHCAAVMDNVTYVGATDSTSDQDTNWGADVLFFGNNEFYQLGTGKRNNVVTPTYIQPLDRVAEIREGKRGKEEEHRFHATPRSTVGLLKCRSKENITTHDNVSRLHSYASRKPRNPIKIRKTRDAGVSEQTTENGCGAVHTYAWGVGEVLLEM
ncbi:hypothetical protein FH972_026195 [Carpinus fangiana]|uniref:Regulator of chromosome condensation 1/beta-lactamase-inhibitor protein II n=1 Tax=Carpinus fangiana TaxID=176857 RepID=A0A5N6L491_9ROSI|nr:hypothetical protein FH972_026195 [Carpinus fangiana]